MSKQEGAKIHNHVNNTQDGPIINGRFYSQPITGVQRYAREIIREIDNLSLSGKMRATVMLPGDARDVPNFSSLERGWLPGLTGQLWEQLRLPNINSRVTLNLCNTGPLATTRHITCIHDVNVFTEPDSYSWSFRAFYKTLLPQLVKRKIAITSVSNHSSGQIGKFLPIDSREIYVIPNGHEHVYTWDSKRSNLAVKLANIRPFVLLLGSRARHKNADFILRQAEEINKLGLDLVVVGGTAKIFSKVNSIAHSNIHRLGVVSDDDLAWLYQNAHCLAFPSRAEGFGLPLIEAMALGCAVVASNRSSIPEVCGSAALLADPDDIAAWNHHFANLLRYRNMKEDQICRGKERVKNFSWRKSAATYVQLLESAAV